MSIVSDAIEADIRDQAERTVLQARPEPSHGAVVVHPVPAGGERAGAFNPMALELARVSSGHRARAAACDDGLCGGCSSCWVRQGYIDDERGQED